MVLVGALLDGDITSDDEISSSANNSTVSEIFFEKFQVPSLRFEPSAWCSLVSNGKSRGLVVYCGHERTSVVSVWDGQVQFQTRTQQACAGKFIDENLKHLLVKRKLNFHQHWDSIIISHMKHSICKVSKRKLSECFDAGQGILAEEEAEYELPDGSVLKIGNERFECCEMLFDPTPFPSAGSQENDTNISSLSELAYNCIMKNSDEHRKDLFKDVVLSGGSFMIEGSAERMENDMKHFALSGYRVNVVKNSQRVYSSWTGAAILSQRSVDKDKWVSKVQYEEYGSNLRK